MKMTIMHSSVKIRIVVCSAVSLLLGFSLFSCSALPGRATSPKTSSRYSDPHGTFPSSSPETDSGRAWRGGRDASDGRPAAVEGGMPSPLSPTEGISGASKGESEKTEDTPGQQELKIEEKNGQPSNGAKEGENSDQARLYEAIDFCQKAQELWKEGRLEEAKKSLDQAYQSILEVKANGDPEIIQQIDDLRFLISKRILEIYASRFQGVKGNHNEIPLPMNDDVQAEIKRFQNQERDFFLQSYARSGRYRPLILAKLKEAGLPRELSWLPLIESGFKVRALSRSRALGLWQFIPSTGYKFGLKRNQWIDERMNVEKSTDAAIAYLNELHGIFGDWTTVLAAYNCGEGTVLRVIRRQRINYLDNFWDLYPLLPRETARYVPRYLAVLHIIKDPQRYGFELNTPDRPLVSEGVEIPKPVRLKNVARTIGVSESVLIEMNPELRYKATPNGYSLNVPPEKVELLLANLERIPQYTPPKTRYVRHRVRRGETLSHIARKYRTSVRSIAKANGIVQTDFIRVGQNLKIPAR